MTSPTVGHRDFLIRRHKGRLGHGTNFEQQSDRRSCPSFSRNSDKLSELQTETGMCQVWVGFAPTGSDLCSAQSDGLRKTLRHLEFVENGVAGAAYGRRRDRVREVVFWGRDARIWQLRWSRRRAPPPGCLLGACGASGPARARRWRRRFDSAVPPCRRDPRHSAADAGRIWLAPTSYVCRRPLRARWGRRASISRCCVTRGRLTEPAGRRQLAARSSLRREDP